MHPKRILRQGISLVAMALLSILRVSAQEKTQKKLASRTTSNMPIPTTSICSWTWRVLPRGAARFRPSCAFTAAAFGRGAAVV